MGRAAHLLTGGAVCRSAATTCAPVGGVCSIAPSLSRRDQCGLAAAPRRINKTEIGFRRQQHRALAPVPQKRAATTRTLRQACVNAARRMASTARFISHLPPRFPHPSIHSTSTDIHSASIHSPFQESTEGSSSRPTFGVNNIARSHHRRRELAATAHSQDRRALQGAWRALQDRFLVILLACPFPIPTIFPTRETERQRAFAGTFHTL